MSEARSNHRVEQRALRRTRPNLPWAVPDTGIDDYVDIPLQSYVHLVETILRGSGAGRPPDRGIVGATQRETQQLRAEWLATQLPKTAGLIGVEWDGQPRLRRWKPHDKATR